MHELDSKRLKYLVVHISDSTFGDRKQIDDWHRHREPPFEMIGYHAVILNGFHNSDSEYNPLLDGKIEPGRPEGFVGAHCQAQGINEVSLGVCLIGKPGKGYPTKAQIGSLVHWCAVKCIKHKLNPFVAVTQHSSWDKKKPLCASLNLTALRLRVVAKVAFIKSTKKDA